MDYYVGIDIGTTATKVVAFSHSGTVLKSVATNYEIDHPQPGFSEQNPDEIYNAVKVGIKETLDHFDPVLPILFSFSAAMHSLIAVDENGSLLTQSIIWADNRSAAIAEDLKKQEIGKAFYVATGVPVHAMSPLCKLIWIKENEPQIFKAAYKFISIKEYIINRLFKTYKVDTGIASASGLLNLKTLQWDENVLEYIGITADRLSTVVTTSEQLFIDQKNADFGRLSNIPFVIGSSDGALSNIGAGAVTESTAAVNIGTSSAIRIMLKEAVTDEQMRTFCYHATGDNYIIGGASNNGAVVLQWLKDDLLQTTDSTETLVEQAAKISAGADGLILLPFIMGERAPIWNAYASAVFFGLSSRHTKAHLVRAVMEGVIYSLYSIGKIILQSKNITEIKASGGFAKSKLWLQMLADVFDKTITVSDAAETAAWGAVKVGLQALGIKQEEQNSKTDIYHPKPENQLKYQRSFAKYERIYEALKDEMKPNEG